MVSDIARVYPPGQEKAIGNQDLGLPEKAGAEKSAVRPPGHELAKGNQDLAR